jgi:Phage gp6-like head-tail connector protein
LAGIDLCSLTDVREFLSVPVADTEQDAIIQRLITVASRAILRYTERELAPAGSAGVARDFLYAPNPLGLMDFAPYDARAVTAVAMDVDTASSYGLTSDQWRLEPVPAADGVYTRLRLWVPYRPASRFPERVVRVTGTWGWATVPEDANQACVVTVGVWLRRDVDAFTTVFNIDEQRLERPEAIPSAARSLLGNLKRRRYA